MLFTVAILAACSTNTPAEAPKKVEAVVASAKPHAEPAAPKASATSPSSIEGLTAVETGTGLTYWVLQAGSGAVPESGQTVQVHYTGWLTDGTQFDSSLTRGKPFSFPLGQHRVIPGWDEGVATMRVGEKRQFKIPPDLAYGDRGAGKAIGPGATLIFDVELLGIN